jgi:large subunit ribosomal protein L30e
MVDIDKAIRMAVDTGKVEFGVKSALRLASSGEVRLIVTSSNCPKKFKEDITYYSKLSKTSVHEFNGTSLELGSLCGKPFPISALSIHDPGNSNILELVK